MESTIQKISNAVVSISDFFNITLGETRYLHFSEWPTLKDKRGVYVIIEGDDIIYVGKGNVKSRQKSHHKKLTGGLTRHDNQEPKGWKRLREDRGVDYDNLQLFVVYLKHKAHESAIEGGLILVLEPYANDENFSENSKLGKV